MQASCSSDIEQFNNVTLLPTEPVCLGTAGVIVTDQNTSHVRILGYDFIPRLLCRHKKAYRVDKVQPY